MVSTAILSHPFPSPFTLDPWILPIGDTALHNGHYFRVPTASSKEVSFFFFFFFGSILSKLAPRHCHPIIQSGWQLLGGISYNRIIRSHGHTSIAYPSGCKMNFLVFCVTMQDSVLVAETFWKPLNNDIGKANQNL